MEPGEILDVLVEVAQEAGVTVRVLSRAAAREGEPLPESNVCRIRGEPWLILASGESIEDRISAAALAVRTFAARQAERRFLPPAVRERLDRA
ncbi:MAG: hypothetical protein GY723_15795 [bacterium]|nr:hypothetical protein [bacterium]MCP5066654.1 hypothetical protein [bacterium]